MPSDKEADILYNQSQSINFMAVGDIMLGRGVKAKINRFGYQYPLSCVANILRESDIVLANLECPITNRWEPVKKTFRFRGDTASLSVMRKAGINLVCLANNHTLDQGRAGLKDTLANLRKKGISGVGAGRNKKAAHRPVIIIKEGLKIAFLAYSAFPCYGVLYNPKKASIAQSNKKSVVKQDIKNAKAIANLVIVSFHWGLEFTSKPSPSQRKLAHLAIDAGADLVLGHHPHVLQPNELYRGKLIVYSLGNFVFDYTSPARCRSTIFKCRLTEFGVSDVSFIPVRIKNCRPEISKRPRKAVYEFRQASNELQIQIQEQKMKNP